MSTGLIVVACVAVPAALALLAAMRNDGMHVGHSVGEGMALVFNVVGKLSRPSGATLRRRAAESADELVGDRNAVLACLSPLLFAAAFALFAGTEVALAILGWSALHEEIPPSWMAGRTAALAAVASVSAAAFWGYVAIDVRAGHIKGPWHDMPSSRRARLEAFAWACAVTSLVAFPLFYGWRELQISAGATNELESLRRWLGFAIIVTLGAIIGAAVLFSLWAVLDLLNVFGIAILAAAGWTLACIEQGCRCGVSAIDIAYALALGLFDLLAAGRGRTLWNWACSFDGFGDRMHFSPINFDQRPRITADF